MAQHWLAASACIDTDGDDYGDPADAHCPFPGLDCDDTDPDVNPGAQEICNDSIDNDCDGLTDYADPDCPPPWQECWENPRQCHGDADGLMEGSPMTGFHYVGMNDLIILQAAHPSTYPNPLYDSCADFDRDGDVDDDDVAILNIWWMVKEPPHGPGVPADCPTGP